MKCLLDTHAFLWSVFEPTLLGPQAARTLRDPANLVYVSVVTLWEISLKVAAGKLELKGVQPEDFPDIAVESGFELLPLAPTEAASFHRLPRSEHKDPFDRLLIRQAIGGKLQLVSKDKRFEVYREFGLKVLW